MNNTPVLLPPSNGAFAEPSPSGLTPGTRSEAEAAFELNATAQTDSAAPDSTEAQRAYRRPGMPHSSSFNYENALRRAQQSSVSSDLSVHSDTPENITGNTVASPSSAVAPFPSPGQGVVPLNYGNVGAIQDNTIKKTRSRGLSLGNLARQQSWNEQDFKHMYNAKLAEETKPDAGYGTGGDPKVQGP